jgi:hypothetical protein
MKKLILVALILFGATFLMSVTKSVNENGVKTEMVKMKSDYEKGWEEGYCEGWKDVKGKYAICPITPICPIPKIDCSEGYKCGYNRGFKSGMEAAKK